MPNYLKAEMPEPSHVGKKPKAGFPKWNKYSDPTSWFYMIRDTTKRFQETTYAICPTDDFMDSGPKKVDYYVHLWHYFKERYHTMFLDPLYQEKYFCFGTRSKWKPTDDQIPDIPYTKMKTGLIEIIMSLKIWKKKNNLDKEKSQLKLMLSRVSIEK